MADKDLNQSDAEATESTDEKVGLLKRLLARTAPLRGGRDIWQLPTLALALVLFTLGFRAWVGGRPGPDYDGALDQAEQLINVEQFDEARTQLNERILPALAAPEATVAHRGRYHMLQGDRMFLEQRALGLDIDENHRLIRQEYEAAERIGLMTLDPVRLARLTETLIALDEDDLARERIRMFPEEAASERRRLLQQLIDRRLAAGEDGRAIALSYLADLLRDPDTPPAMRHWAVARQARIQIDAGHMEPAIDRLLVEVARLDQWDSPEAGELFLLLGEGYAELGDLAEAAANAERAAGMLPQGAELRGDVEVLLGRLSQARGDAEEARDRFTVVARDYRETPVLMPALMGLAEAEGMLGDAEASLQAYARLIDRMKDGVRHPRIKTDRVDYSMDQFHRKLIEHGDFPHAERLAEMIIHLHGDGAVPAEAVYRLASTRRRAALNLLNESTYEDENFLDVTRIDYTRLDPVTREDIRRQFSRAARGFRDYARRVVGNPTEMARALMLAGDSFDRAGETANALEIFKEYVENHPDGANHLDARYRAAQARQALHTWQDAIASYEAIIETDATTQHAYRSYVPLARCYMKLDGEDAARRAESWLQRALDGSYFSPEAHEYQEALTELARMYRRVGRFDDAIVRLEEVLERYPQTALKHELQNDLADALRLSAMEIDQTLATEMPQTRRRNLETLRRDRLRRALDLYQTVRDGFAAEDPASLSAVERSVLRNAVFYRGDCAYALGSYDEAIDYYDAAAQQYADDPSSLVAMAQIVSCYEKLGRLEEARTAEERARNRLRDLPAEVWANESTTMSREHWERWLNVRDRLADAG